MEESWALARINALASFLGTRFGALRFRTLALPPRKGERPAAITKILATQQSNWNQGNVDAFWKGIGILRI